LIGREGGREGDRRGITVELSLLGAITERVKRIVLWILKKRNTRIGIFSSLLLSSPLQ